ncbi:4'-phosphopantetheinyl transferase superfamily protein [Rhizobium subbaraonis]|uniref:4'-phosphopantetheinyl transferase superfamily protein n=1 Tax=Rhizobium subbaraonis TaxID=908946 RepID=A0A285U1S5_9HYPH|nr:4'-phosphopantetheinyl transferase superfamily protein [Rhizobium subbaraonis]SOC35910.1 4'-phosphopantetheinyl transferase superfamily protein [Rhizobium subbaraonis]
MEPVADMPDPSQSTLQAVVEPVHVLAARVGAVLSAMPHDVLDAAERRQADGFVHLEDRERYQAGHALVRHAIAAVSGIPASALAFVAGPNGKPATVVPMGLDFNLTHSGRWVAIGLSRSGAVGVDVEADRPEAFWREIAASFLSPMEMRDLPSAGTSRYLRVWTAKEAALKACGAGFSIAPESISVAIQAGGFSADIAGRHVIGTWHLLDDDHLLAEARDAARASFVACRTSSELTDELERLTMARQAWFGGAY